MLVTARKRSLGQGNIFEPVCHSVYRWEYLGKYTPWQVPPPLPSRYIPRAGTSPRQVYPLAGTPPPSRWSMRVSGYHADTPITIKAEASSKDDSCPN